MRARIPRAGASAAADDPIAVIDRDLAWLAAQLRRARERGEQTAAARLADVIDLHLDERGRATGKAPGPCGP